MTRQTFWMLAALIAGASAHESMSAETTTEPAWLSPQWGILAPAAHLNFAAGDSSGNAATLAGGHHDPSREDGTVQGIELSLSLRTDHVEGFVTHVHYFGADEEWSSEWEEAFITFRDILPGIDLRAGRMLGRFGQHNARHLHAWDFVDAPLAISRLLGEHGLWYDGADVTWLHQDVATTFGLTLGYGGPIGHGHAEHDEHAEHDDHDDHADHDEHDEHAEEYDDDGHDDHGIGFDDRIFSSRLFGQYRPNDFHHYESGLSLAIGDDANRRRIAVYGLDLVYRWRERGMEPGGQALTWTTELLYRDVEDGHADDHDHDLLPGGGEFGFYTSAIYTLHPALDLGLRVGYVEGNHDLETEQRLRISPAITAYLDPYRRTSFRVQYNYDDLDHDGEEHTVWAQIGISWGGAEVR